MKIETLLAYKPSPKYETLPSTPLATIGIEYQTPLKTTQQVYSALEEIKRSEWYKERQEKGLYVVPLKVDRSGPDGDIFVLAVGTENTLGYILRPEQARPYRPKQPQPSQNKEAQPFFFVFATIKE